jgi:predicted nuclease of predicted toxin-antitoxin system
MSPLQARLLFDQNLSNRLPAALADVLPGSMHVRDVGLAEGDDSAVWTFAAEHGYTIISKDDDFRERARLLGHPPRVILLKVPNCSTRAIEQIVRSHLSHIEKLHLNPEASLLVISEAVAFYLLRRAEKPEDG